MGDYSSIIKNMIYFILFVGVVLIIAAVGLNLYLKKFSFDTQKSKVYGILHRLDNLEIISLSITTLNYLFLVWNAMMTVEMNALYASLILSLSLISCLLSRDYEKMPIALLVSLINCFAIYIVHFVHIYLQGEVGDIFMRISIFFIIAFVFIYFTYNYINDINDIVKKNVSRIKKKRVGVKNGN